MLNLLKLSFLVCAGSTDSPSFIRHHLSVGLQRFSPGQVDRRTQLGLSLHPPLPGNNRPRFNDKEHVRIGQFVVATLLCIFLQSN